MQAEDSGAAESEDGPVVVLGAGSIGVSFAAVFEDAGRRVLLVDPDPDRRAAASEGIAAQREAAALAGLARGGKGWISVLGEAGPELASASLVIECGPERLETKQAIFADLLRRTGEQCVIVTASSAIPISRIVPAPEAQARCLVAHPTNPPAVLRVIELCPAPGTLPATMERAATTFTGAGFHPVLLRREVEGFLLNRLQSAVLREAYRLVDEEVADVAAIEAVMRLGLGPRWALSGPFETAELNTPGGIRAHAARMGPAYARIGAERGETVEWHEALVTRVESERRTAVPADKLPKKALWRARAVARLVAARDRLLGEWE